MTLYGIPIVWAAIAAAILFFSILLLVALSYRTVVPTNRVDIVQSSKARTSFGGVDENGKLRSNTYYRWPSWLPFIGVKVISLPLSVFDLPLNDYGAYDKGRLPFVIDIMSFFRISDSGMAAERINTFQELQEQLVSILKGASRTILATSEIEQIMETRAVFGQKFTDEVHEQLKQWGVTPVKNIELMDIRDSKESNVIANIMAKKKSEIEKESRIAVAANHQAARTAEIDAEQAVQMQQQQADQTVGERTAATAQAVGMAKQKAEQNIQEEAKVTAEKIMAVKNVNDTRTAEIAKTVAETQASQAKQVSITNAEATAAVAKTTAEGEKNRVVTLAEAEQRKRLLEAEGLKGAMVFEAEGIKAKGEAEGAAQTAVLMAPVNSQLELAKGIGANEKYQAYMVQIKQVEAAQAIGVEQAGALKAAEIKIIVTGGSPAEGAKTVMDLFTPKGAALMGAAVESLRNTSETAAAVIDKVAPKPTNGDARL